MMAVVKKIEGEGGRKAAFSVPTVDQVKAYMKEKKGWPDKFIDYYAEKFWNTYEASGWRLSNGNKMKSWTAAFNAQWQDIRYQQDRDMLNECRKTHLTVVQTQNNYLNQLLTQYRKNFDSVSSEALVAAYDYLKENKLMKLSPDEKDLIKRTYGNNVEKGKAACVITLFNNMINYGKHF